MEGNVNSVFFVTGIALLCVGFICLISGIIILLSKTLSKDIREVTAEATNLAKKGLVSEISGTIGNAIFLIKELNAMVETSRGIGMILIIAGSLLIASALIILLRIGK